MGSHGDGGFSIPFIGCALKVHYPKHYQKVVHFVVHFGVHYWSINSTITGGQIYPFWVPIWGPILSTTVLARDHVQGGLPYIIPSRVFIPDPLGDQILPLYILYISPLVRA